MEKRSPAAITSEPRKNTITSPSVCAVGLIQDLDRLAVEVDLLLLGEEGRGRQHLLRQLLLALGGAAHPVERVLVRDDAHAAAAATTAAATRRRRRRRQPPSPAPRCRRCARGAVGVDDVAERPVAEAVAQRVRDASPTPPGRNRRAGCRRRRPARRCSRRRG